MKMMAEKWTAFQKQSYLNLETFRKNGEGVPTPVWFMCSGDVLYVRTADNSGKVKRIRREPRVRIAPCAGNGQLKGDWVEARAEISTDDAVNREAEMLANKKYGLIKWIFELISRTNHLPHITLVIHPN
jgi:uncharacterized protein